MFYFKRSLLLILIILGLIAVPRITMLIFILVNWEDFSPSGKSRSLIIEDILTLSVFFLIPRISAIVFVVYIAYDAIWRLYNEKRNY